MRLSFSPRAALDLEEIADYIARGNPRRALSFVSELEAECHRVAEMPTAFPKREDIAPGVQAAVHGNYLVLFRVWRGSVRIERIVHGARKLSGLL